jgi:hypothetical protein
MAMGMAQRPGTSTGYEGAATAGYMDVDADMDEVSFFRSFLLFLCGVFCFAPREALCTSALKTRSSRSAQ